MIRIGVITPPGLLLDDEYWALTDGRATLHFTRTPWVEGSVDLVKVERVADEGDIVAATHALSILNPASVAYACTSGSYVHGVDGEFRLRRIIAKTANTEAVTTSGAILDALAAIGARRVSVVTPYDQQLTSRFAGFLSEASYEVVGTGCLSISDPLAIAQVGPDEIVELILQSDAEDADAVVVACTNLRAVSAMALIRQKTTTPVVTANGATVWAMLTAAGVFDGGPLDLVDPRYEAG